jgi:23S rRNA pseudouridine1911/1915/1917 synthase
MKKIYLQTTIPEQHAGQRIDQCLAQLFTDFSRSKLQEWLKSKQILLDNQPVRAKDKVIGGEHVTIDAMLESNEQHQAEAIELNIIFEDEDLIILNKPAGLVVHPAAGNISGTLLNALLHHAPELDMLPRAGIIHRIDKDTTGLLVVTRTIKAHTRLTADLQQRLIKREYQALAMGRFTAGSSINAPIDRHPKYRTKMAVVHGGKPALTHYRIAERFNDYTLLDVQLETGRTHQIRVHMAHIAHPLLGDQTYAGRLKIPRNASEKLVTYLRQFKRQALHAAKLTLSHPASNEIMQWQAPLPIDFENLLKTLRQENRYEHD